MPLNDVENQHINTQESSTADPLKDVRNIFSQISNQLQQHLPNLPNQDELMNTLKQHSTNFVNNMNEYLKNATEEVSNKC